MKKHPSSHHYLTSAAKEITKHWLNIALQAYSNLLSWAQRHALLVHGFTFTSDTHNYKIHLLRQKLSQNGGITVTWMESKYERNKLISLR